MNHVSHWQLQGSCLWRFLRMLSRLSRNSSTSSKEGLCSLCVGDTLILRKSSYLLGIYTTILSFFCVLCLTTCVIHNHARCVIPSMCTFSFLSVISTYICRKLSRRSLARTAKDACTLSDPFLLLPLMAPSMWN